MDHNNKDNAGMKGMMWMMAICCGVPLLLFLFAEAGGIAAGGSKWIIIGAVALMFGAHFFMMRRGHGHAHDDKDASVTMGKVDEKKNEHKGHNCCH